MLLILLFLNIQLFLCFVVVKLFFFMNTRWDDGNGV